MKKKKIASKEILWQWMNFIGQRLCVFLIMGKWTPKEKKKIECVHCADGDFVEKHKKIYGPWFTDWQQLEFNYTEE